MSPVVAVVLLTAITLLVAASVWIFAQGFGEPIEGQTSIAMVTDHVNGRVRVITADSGIDWFEDVEITGTCVPLLNGGPLPTTPGQFIRGGDVLSGCQPTETLRITHVPSNILLYDVEFRNA